MLDDANIHNLTLAKVRADPSLPRHLDQCRDLYEGQEGVQSQWITNSSIVQEPGTAQVLWRPHCSVFSHVPLIHGLLEV